MSRHKINPESLNSVFRINWGLKYDYLNLGRYGFEMGYGENLRKA